MKKGQYSKWLIVGMVILNIAFAAGIMLAMKAGADEPTALIDRWFDWTTAEIFATAGIKISKIAKDIFDVLKGSRENNI